MTKAKTRIVYRYIDDVPLLWKRDSTRSTIKPGQFISKALFDTLPARATIRQEIRCG